MAQKPSPAPPMPARALTLDQAYERAYVALYRSVHAFCEADPLETDELQRQLSKHAHKLTQDLIDVGVGGTLAYQLARPPVG